MFKAFKALNETLEAYQRRDPAARSKLEILLLYQGVHATLYHRLAHWLYCHKWKFLARVVSHLGGLADDDAHAVVDDEPAADLGPGVYLDARPEPGPLGDDPGQEFPLVTV